MTIVLRRFPVALFLIGAIAATPCVSHAAQSYDSCTGFIDSIPTTITTQGVWCLNKNLGTAITTGAAITIATNNVTIDCNDFKLGGLAAGDGSRAAGIYGSNRQNATIRHCNVRGFYRGIALEGGAGHLVEDNRFDNNLETGLFVTGENNTVRRNRIYDTGGSPTSNSSRGMYVEADVIDNTVAGVFAIGGDNTYATGINLRGPWALVRDNRVVGLQMSGSGYAWGIYVYNAGVTVDGNHVSNAGELTGEAIGGSQETICSNNVVGGFTTAFRCTDGGGNTSR